MQRQRELAHHHRQRRQRRPGHRVARRTVLSRRRDDHVALAVLLDNDLLLDVQLEPSDRHGEVVAHPRLAQRLDQVCVYKLLRQLGRQAHLRLLGEHRATRHQGLVHRRQHWVSAVALLEVLDEHGSVRLRLGLLCLGQLNLLERRLLGDLLLREVVGWHGAPLLRFGR